MSPIDYHHILLSASLLYLHTVSSEQFPYLIGSHTEFEKQPGFTIELDLKSKYCVLDLYPNRKLKPQNYSEKHETDETDFIQRPEAKEIEICHFTGKIRGIRDSWVAVNTCQGISGVLFDGRGTYSISNFHHLENGTQIQNQEMIVSNRDNVTGMDFICGYSDPSTTTDEMGEKRFKRDSDPFNNSTYYIKMALLVDYSLYTGMGNNATLVYRRCEDIINSLNRLYQEFGIFVSIACIGAWDKYDRFGITEDSNHTLHNFGHYAAGLLMNNSYINNVQLLTHVRFADKLPGHSLFEEMCDSFHSYGVTHDALDTNITEVVTTLARGLAHNLGVEFDANNCTCAYFRCITWSNDTGTFEWNHCLAEQLRTILTKKQFTCLLDKPTSAINKRSCKVDPPRKSHLKQYLVIGIATLMCVVGFIWWFWSAQRRPRVRPNREDQVHFQRGQRLDAIEEVAEIESPLDSEQIAQHPGVSGIIAADTSTSDTASPAALIEPKRSEARVFKF